MMLLSLYFGVLMSLPHLKYCNGLRIFTSTTYWIQSLNQMGLDTTTTSELTFQVVACSDVHVAFFDSVFGLQTPRYELVIGGWSNTNSTFRQSIKYFVNLNHTPLDCCTFHPFWVSWYGGTLKAGNGYTVGLDVFLQLTNTDMGTIIKVGITTGWGHTGVWALSLNNVPLTVSDFDVDGYVECPTNTVLYYLPQQQETTLIVTTASLESITPEMTSSPVKSDISITTGANSPNSFLNTDLSMSETDLLDTSSVFNTASEASDESKSSDKSSQLTSVVKQATTSANHLQQETSSPEPLETSHLASESKELKVSVSSEALESSYTVVPTNESGPPETSTHSRTSEMFESTPISPTILSTISKQAQSSSSHNDLETSISDIDLQYVSTLDELLESTPGNQDLNEPLQTMDIAISELTTVSSGELNTSGGISTKPPHSTSMTSNTLTSKMITKSLFPTEINSGESSSVTLSVTSKMPTTPITFSKTILPSNICEGCPCDWPLYGMINLTLSEKIERIRRTLTLVKSDLSAARRKLTSAHDIRSSSRYMGASGATILVLVFGIIILADVQRILAFFIPTKRSPLTIIVER